MKRDRTVNKWWVAPFPLPGTYNHGGYARTTQDMKLKAKHELWHTYVGFYIYED